MREIYKTIHDKYTTFFIMFPFCISSSASQ